MRAVRNVISKGRIVLKNPGQIPRLMKNYLFLLMRVQRLRTVEIALTYQCQCTCPHCSSRELYDPRREELTIRGIHDVIDQSVEQGAIHILFTGGETLLAPRRVLSGIQHAKKHHCITSIDTNGIRLDEEMTKRLAKKGLDVVCISIDSLSEKVHDSSRGFRGCLAKAKEGVFLCGRYGILPIVSVLITREKLRNGEVSSILDFAKKNGAEVIFCLPVPTESWNDENAQLDEEDMVMVERLLTHPSAKICAGNNYASDGCAAGSEKIAVTLYGDVMPCSFLNERWGNIRKERLETILSRMRRDPRYKKVNRNVKCLAAGK